MQHMMRIYQNKVTVDVSDQGWCLINYGSAPVEDTVWGIGLCLVFYAYTPSSDEKFPDETFAHGLEQMILRQPFGIVWIANPKDDFKFWNMTGAFCRYSHVKMGNCWLHFQDKMGETDDNITFTGVFGVDDTAVPLVENRIVLDLNNPYGVLSFTLTPDPAEFLCLDAGIRYVRILPENSKDIWKYGLTEHINMRILSIREKISMPAQITPSALEQSQRSWFSLEKNTFECTFLSPAGEKLELVSQDAKLVFEKTASTVSKDVSSQSFLPTGAEWYLGIDGSFLVKNDKVMMPGQAGTEYFSGLSALRFVVGQSALLSTNGEKIIVETAEKRISAAWISVQGMEGEKTAYYSSPVAMPFFEIKKYAEDSCGFFPYSAKVAEYTETPSPAFPVFAWGGLSFVPDTLNPSLIEEGISALRYQILSGEMNKSCDRNETEKYLTAPCGLCVGVQPDSGVWNWVGIAQTADAGLPDVKLMRPSLLTRKSLQQTKCLLIAATKDEFHSLSENQIQFEFLVDGWKLRFSEEYWNDNSLFMIKYTDEVTVRSLLAGTQQLEYLLSIAYDGKGNVKKGFETVINLLDRKEFQGILLLGGAVETDSLIPELNAVLRWGESSSMEMIYAVISNGKITLNGSEVSVAKSSIDALALYEGTPKTNTDLRPFDFCTREMVTVIKQTKVNYFHSRSELLLYKLLGADLNTAGDFEGNELMLSGRLETTGNTSSYKFSLDSALTYRAKDSAMNSFVVNNVLLSGDTEELTFYISGTQTYLKCDGLDLFSYDEIGFDGIKLVKNGDAAHADYSSYRLLTDICVLREHSFAKEFSADAKEAKACVSSVTPENLGFSSINTPIKQGTLGDVWNGIIWTLPLNSSGTLGKNEMLNMELLGAWSGNNYYIGIRMGGVFNRNFSLQGILTAGFQGVTLEKMEERMFFKLHGFALKALGFTFPGKGVDVMILGENGKIAWCAAYEEKKDG
ncbi:MAG: hypothetical protein PHY47_13410 [Lachnospiraceae bacterium]|nr:hypothetical protein [Lachnospiraceae bacterium]